MPHYPNPFDFVPFPPMPILNTEKQFDALGKKLSGYLELEIKALTPVHVVGRVKGSQAEHGFLSNGESCARSRRLYFITARMRSLILAMASSS